MTYLIYIKVYIEVHISAIHIIGSCFDLACACIGMIHLHPDKVMSLWPTFPVHLHLSSYLSNYAWSDHVCFRGGTWAEFAFCLQLGGPWVWTIFYNWMIYFQLMFHKEVNFVIVDYQSFHFASHTLKLKPRKCYALKDLMYINQFNNIEITVQFIIINQCIFKKTSDKQLQT